MRCHQLTVVVEREGDFTLLGIIYMLLRILTSCLCSEFDVNNTRALRQTGGGSRISHHTTESARQVNNSW